MSPSGRTIVYVSCADDKHIAVLGFDGQTGSLRPMGIVKVPGTEAASPQSLPMAISPDKRFLYAALRSEPFPLVTFAIGADGMLRQAGQTHLADSMCYLATDATGRALFGASYGGAKLSVNPIGADGIAQAPAQVVDTPPKAHSVLVDPGNLHVYSACLGGDAVICQRFDAASGRLDAQVHVAAHTPAGSGPRHMALGRDGRTLYVIAEQGGAILVYARDPASGALEQRQQISLLPDGVAPPVASADLHLTPDGRFLYGSERITHTLNGFAVAADGTLSPVCRVPSEPTPRGFAISANGRFLLCAGLSSGNLATYAIEPSGVLVRQGALPVGAGANWVEIHELA